MQEIVANTNIEAVFDLILDTAVRNNVPQEQLPTHLYIFSDMEFDSCVVSNSYQRFSRVSKLNPTLFEQIRERYEAYGYRMPQVIFWNLDARNNQHPVTQHETGAALVSGFSPSTFQYIMEGIVLTPMQTMMKVLNAPRYAMLSEAFN